MKFKNNTPIDVYVDLGTLRRVAPGEEIDLPGAVKVEGLTAVHEPAPKKTAVKKPEKKKPTKSTKNVGVSGTI